MRPIREGERGPAVEDVQRRLRRLGYDLGPTGIDGVFLGKTAEAVRAFQRRAGLEPDGVVDDATWAALVDATFVLGDRMLFLRVPHFHGQDVAVLQQALNALGFPCGEVDGIFGAFCERATREFQRSVGLVPDGIVGDETVKALLRLRHVWEGRSGGPQDEDRLVPARRAEVLAAIPVAVRGLDPLGTAVAQRIVNLALASAPDARVSISEGPDGDRSGARLVLGVGSSGTVSASGASPVVRVEPVDTLGARLTTALASAAIERAELVIEVPEVDAGDDLGLQRLAVHVLDALCQCLSSEAVAW